MGFGTNKTPVEIIRESAFGGTYFRDIYSGVNDKFYKNTWKEFKDIENITKSIMVLIIMMLVQINIALNVAHH